MSRIADATTDLREKAIHLLNRNPIFIGSFSRGGSTILLNLLASHPDVCTVGETHQVFKGRKSDVEPPWKSLQRCLLHDLPVIASTGQDLFSPTLFRPRKPVSKPVQRFIDRVLYNDKLRSRTVHFNLFKAPDLEYTLQEIAESRLAGKNVSGAVFLSDMFAEMYPDAKFVYLVRNGLALCEGYMRRRKSPEWAADCYRTLVRKMMDDCRRLPGATLVRFEDILNNPVDQLLQLYARLDLDQSRASHVRLQLRKMIDERGRHRVEGGAEWDVVWYKLRNIGAHLDRDINDRQIRRLGANDRNVFLRNAGDVMEQLGYPTGAATPSNTRRLAA